MTRSVDDLLRTAVHDLADEAAAPAGLAGAALAKGHRRRRRRRAAAAVAALTVVAAVASAPVVINRDPSPLVSTLTPVPVTSTLPVPPFSGERALVVPGGARVIGIDGPIGLEGQAGQAGIQVLDGATGGYRKLTKAVMRSLPSPNNRHVLVSYLEAEHLELLDLVTGKSRKLPFELGDAAVWSSDGSRLLVTRTDGFAVVEADTGRVREHRIEEQQRRCFGYCQFTWLAGETQVALPQTWTLNSDTTQISGLAVFEAGTGELLRNIPIKKAPVGRDAWSPDGSQVLVRPTTPDSIQVVITEVETRREVASFTAHWAGFLRDGTVLGWDGTTVTRYDRSGHPLEVMPLPAALEGRWLTFGP